MMTRNVLTYGVLAHTGHDHSRDKSVDEAADQTADQIGVETTAETSADETADEAGLSVQEAPAVKETGQETVGETQAAVNGSGLFEGFSVGVGEPVFALLLVLPFLLRAVKRRALLKRG